MMCDVGIGGKRGAFLCSTSRGGDELVCWRPGNWFPGIGLGERGDGRGPQFEVQLGRHALFF